MQESGDPALLAAEHMYHAALRDILEHLMTVGKTLSDFDLPQPPVAGPRENRLLAQERDSYNRDSMAETMSKYPGLNNDQKSVFDAVRASLNAYQDGTLVQVQPL